MTIPVTLQYSFAAGSGNRLLSNLDTDLASLRDAINGLGNGSSIITSGIFNTADIGTANVSTISFSSATGGNVVITGGTADFANLILAGSLQPGSGGTGVNSYTDGQVLIGSNVTNGLVSSKIASGNGITIINTPGSISISSNITSISTQLRQAIFTSSGTFTANSSTIHKITIVGGGGAGGGVTTSPSAGVGGGGAGGGFSQYEGLIASGFNVVVSVGNGGNSTTIGTTISEPGGNSSVVLANGFTIIATGGNPGDWGSSNVAINGGSGGLGINGNINIPGQNGFSAVSSNVHAINAFFPGAGGSTPMGFGGPVAGLIGNSTISSKQGSAGLKYGGGGSGGARSFGGPTAGAKGAQGIVIFEWLA